jgi:hypothetical protein
MVAEDGFDRDLRRVGLKSLIEKIAEHLGHIL